MALSEKKLNKIFNDVYSGKISIENLPDELSAFTFSEVIKFVEDGFGKLVNDLKIARMADYNSNITAFSGAKTFQNVKDMNNLVFLPDGTKRPFKEFKEFAFQINDKYNVDWLRTEQDTAFSVSQGADKWMDIEDDKDIFPVLKYQTAADERVRADHAAWDNIVRPVDDPFWDTRMPPNGWNCRCTVIKESSGKKTDLRGIPKNDDIMFSNNPGKDKFVFNEKKHPYFKHTKSEGPAFKKALEWK